MVKSIITRRHVRRSLKSNIPTVNNKNIFKRNISITSKEITSVNVRTSKNSQKTKQESVLAKEGKPLIKCKKRITWSETKVKSIKRGSITAGMEKDPIKLKETSINTNKLVKVTAKQESTTVGVEKDPIKFKKATINTKAVVKEAKQHEDHMKTKEKKITAKKVTKGRRVLRSQKEK